MVSNAALLLTPSMIELLKLKSGYPIKKFNISISRKKQTNQQTNKKDKSDKQF